MSLTCPKCNMRLPENDELEYHFCPRCGAEIEVSGTAIADNFQTIPPDLYHPVTQHQKHSPHPESREMPPSQIPDQTMEPVIPATSKPRPELIPPPGPPPASFFREDPPHSPSVSENPLEAQIQRPRSPLKLLIIIGAVAILIGGIIFLFLV